MRILLTLFVTVAFAALTFNQIPSAPPSPTAASTSNATMAMDKFNLALENIRAQHPDYTEPVFRCDQQVIESTLPTVTEKFKAVGFDEKDAADATVNSWENIRLWSALPSTKCMSQRSFREYVSKLGRMSFRSSPSGATIELDAKPLNQQTDSKRWFEPKEYKVKYSKPDCCLPFERTCTITESAETDCFGELPRKP